MVQILPPVERQPSFLESLIGGAANRMDEYSQSQAKQKALEKEYALRGGLEKTKQEAKFANQLELQEQKQSFLKDLLNKGKQKENFLSDQGNELELGDQGVSSGFDISKVSDEDAIIAEALGFPGLREAKNAAIREKEGASKEKRRQFESDREYHAKGADPVIKEAQSILKESPIKRGLREQQRRDIMSGNVSGVIPYLVDKTGLEAYRNPESARFKTISKQRFVEGLHSLGAAGARANQFIEKQLVDAQASLGRSEEANMTILDLDEFIDDMKEQRANFEMELADEDVKKFGYPRNDIARRADKKMELYAEQRQDEMAYDIRKRHEQNLSDEDLTKEIIMGEISPDTPLTLRAARILMIKNNDDEKKAQSEAKKLGFRLPNEKTFLRG